MTPAKAATTIAARKKCNYSENNAYKDSDKGKDKCSRSGYKATQVDNTSVYDPGRTNEKHAPEQQKQRRLSRDDIQSRCLSLFLVRSNFGQ